VKIVEILKEAKEKKASDIHLVVGKPPMFRVNGKLQEFGEERLMPDSTKELIYSILNEEQRVKFELDKELDFSFGVQGMGRYRANIHYQRETIAAALRAISTTVPKMEDLNLPSVLKSFTEYKNGLVLVTGPTGSGKFTTLATMIDEINRNKHEHIITIEDPIEYLHRHDKSLVEQREIGTDTSTFAQALRYALRQDPDVILIGEMRDLETIVAALTAAETGHLVFGTLHTRDAAQTVDRIVDVFPHEQQQQIRLQLSNSLKGIVSQQLIPNKNGDGMELAYEILVGTPAIGNLIREAKTHQIYSMIQTGSKFGMRTMDSVLKELFQAGKISASEFDKRMRSPDSISNTNTTSWKNF
jgi:twitching motility protein PilT